jgi:hypothetical protein
MMVMRKESRKGVKERTGDERCECTGLHHRAFHKTISFKFVKLEGSGRKFIFTGQLVKELNLRQHG